MRNPLSDKIVDIKPSGIRKFFDIVSEMEDAISLGVGEPDFDTPWPVSYTHLDVYKRQAKGRRLSGNCFAITVMAAQRKPQILKR